MPELLDSPAPALNSDPSLGSVAAPAHPEVCQVTDSPKILREEIVQQGASHRMRSVVPAPLPRTARKRGFPCSDNSLLFWGPAGNCLPNFDRSYPNFSA